MMIVGDPAVFAIESRITEAYDRLSFRALGSFVICISGHRYGVDKPDATLLACSFEEVKRRTQCRGTHFAPFAETEDASLIAEAFCRAMYSDEQHTAYFGKNLDQIRDLIHSNHLAWAPDGDEAFDDGSHVLQFDVNGIVRLVGFKTESAGLFNRASLRDVRISSEEFYDVLDHWLDAFEAEWRSRLKV